MKFSAPFVLFPVLKEILLFYFPLLHQHRVTDGAEQPGRVKCPKSTTCFPFAITRLLLVLIAFCYRLWSDPKEPRRGRLQEQPWTVASMVVSLTSLESNRTWPSLYVLALCPYAPIQRAWQALISFSTRQP